MLMLKVSGMTRGHFVAAATMARATPKGAGRSPLYPEKLFTARLGR